jgi:hypothetical protein
LQTSPRRLEIIQKQFDAANASRHPELGGHVVAEETRKNTSSSLLQPCVIFALTKFKLLLISGDFWRCGQEGQNCPSPQRFHFGADREVL